MATLLLIHGGLWEDTDAEWFWRRPGIIVGLRLLPDVTELPGCPEAPRPEFAPHLESFLAAVAGFVGP